MPLLPGFEGQIGTATGTAIQAITHWNYASICRLVADKMCHLASLTTALTTPLTPIIRAAVSSYLLVTSNGLGVYRVCLCLFERRGSKSLMARLRDANIDPMNYVTFCGLRTHAQLNGQLV